MADKPLNLIVDYRTSEKELQRLLSFGFNLIPTEKVTALYEAVDGHPDIQFFLIENKLIAHKELSKNQMELLSKLGVSIVLGNSSLSLPYPGNIPYNALFAPDLLMHRLDATDPVILNEITKLKKSREIMLINVRQGYSRCSCAYVGNNSYITEDTVMADKLLTLGKQVFYQKHSNVYLEGFDFGFIGGAISLISIHGEELVLISGSLDSYFYGKELMEFLKRRNIRYECIGEGKLMDRGTIISF